MCLARDSEPPDIVNKTVFRDTLLVRRSTANVRIARCFIV